MKKKFLISLYDFILKKKFLHLQLLSDTFSTLDCTALEIRWTVFLNFELTYLEKIVKIKVRNDKINALF